MARRRLQRKQRRRRGRGSPGAGGERPVIQGLWVHEVDWLKSGESSSDVIPPPPQFTDPQPCGPADEDAGCSCTDVCECATGQSGDTDCDLDQDSESNSSGGGEDDAPVTADLTFDLMQVSSASDVRWSDSAGSLHSLLGDSRSAPSGVNKSQCAFGSNEPDRPDAFAEVLRGRVTQMTKASTSPLFRSLIKGTLREWRGSERLHEGLIFHQVRHRNSPSSPAAQVLLSFPAFSFCVDREATSTQQVSVPGGGGVPGSPPHPERLLRRRLLRPGRGDGIHVRSQEGETSGALTTTRTFEIPAVV